MTLTVSTAARRDNFFWQLLNRPACAAALVLLLLIMATSLAAPWLAPYPPAKLSIMSRLSAPGLSHFFGSDELGRDVFTRMLYAGQTSVMVGAAVVVFATLAGIVLGLAAGYFRRLDTPVSRLIDAMMSFPDILLAIALVAALGPTAVNVIIALGTVYMARVVRASTLVVRELPYVEAAKALGVPTPMILLRHILRNIASPLLVQATFIFANAILAEAGLSFLGVGISPDIPTWGTMISQGRQYMDDAPWIMLFPGLAILLTVISLQLLGDALRDCLDPRLSKGA
ncbi:ABC transporter permease [Candidatus Sodalis endolongispinus]|uniref:ABC transporter permease n=1 Tax=Candidatus Sodalis endolongispinus TaxID=2812662 RepID=A0ABS5YCX5_9GAMM|nr:ABC transporter permease [Candidatus Sodalis endolongispinus]MBT9432875.1 ABC transporter permease [Candidatus Sodalis endolongispinus]